MKKILLILCALLLTAVGASAQTWTAPQPTASSLTSGNDYYLYNVGANGFLVNGNNYLTQASVGSQGLITTVTSTDSGWTIKFATVVGTYDTYTDCYLYYTSDGGGKLWCDQTTLAASGYFTITEESDDTYIIVSSQATDTYVGWDEEDGGTIVSPVIAEVGANTYWQFITADNYNVYLAKIDLYDALVEAEEMGMTDSDTAYKDAGDVYTSSAATVTEIEAALEALIEAMESHASADHPVDVTSFYITNPSFDTGDLTGWTNSVSSGFAYHADPHTNGDITISGYAEAYVSPNSNLGNRKLYQTLSLPKGTYKLEADANATQQGDESVTVTGVYLYASSLFTSMTSVHTGNGLPEHYSVSFEVAEEGSVEIGFEVSNSDANWVCVDNFLLYYLGEEVTGVTDTDSDYKKGDVATIYGHKYDVKSDNMVENHSFELGFTGWTNSADFETEITSSSFELRSDGAQDGEVYLVGTTNSGASSDGSLGKAWAIESGKSYYFSYYVKGLGTATDGGYLETSLGDEKGTESVSLNTPTVTSEWQKIEVLFTNTNYEYVQVKFRWLNNQWGFDNFQLYQVEPAEDVLEGVSDDSEYEIDEVVNADGYACTIKSDNMFVNGGFNADMYGWTAGGYYVAADPANFDVEAEGGFNDGAYLVASSAGTSSEKTPSQAIAVEEGKTYLFIGYTSGKTPDNGNLQYNALFKMSDAVSEASSDKIIVQLEWGADPTETAEEWTKTMAVFTVPAEEEDGTFPYVGMRMGWSGGSYDGFQLYEVDAKELEYPVDVTWALANPSFEVDKVENLTEDATRSTSEAGDYTGGAYTIEGLTGWTLGGNNAVKDLMTEACKRTDNNFGAPGTPTNGTQMLYLRNNTSTTGYVEQTITLPAGEYMLTVDSKCVSTNSASAVLVAGGKSTALDIHSSYENGDELLDWDTAMLTFSLYATTDVTIGVDISYSGTGSFLLDNFKLYSVEKIEKTISWEMTSAGWGTMILPFAATLADGLTAYSCDGTTTDEENETTTVDLTEVGQSINANTPYIIKCTDEDAVKAHSFTGTPINTVETYTDGILTGTLVDLAIEKGAALTIDGTNYVLQNHTEGDEPEGLAFYPITDESEGVELDAYHCYLTLQNSGDAQNPVRAFISLPGSDNEETGIVAVEGAETLANDAIYDLSGRHVSKAVKGVYIQNGKKVLVK